ncbi:MAG: sensor histidine kinase [Chloroflexi bacterium]|nr:sensor histidine kinase [Chloroflexota bacterium]
MARVEAPIEDFTTQVATLPRSFWRRHGDTSLARLPGGIRIAVLTSPFAIRWATWGIAGLILLVADLPRVNRQYEPWLLIGTMFQTAVITFYVPVIRPVLLPAVRRWVSSPENNDVLALGLLDLALAMVAVYVSGGWGSPYFQFALTALLIPSFFLTFRGVLMLGGAYIVAYVFGVVAFGEGVYGGWKDANLNSFIGALATPMLVALVPNYLGNVLRELDAARKDAVEALDDSDLLFRVARAFLEGGRALNDALPLVARAAEESSRFQAVTLLIPDDLSAGGETSAYGVRLATAPPEPSSLAGAFAGEGARTFRVSALPPPLDRAFGWCGWVGVAPLRSLDAVEGWLVVGTRERPQAILREVRLLDALGGQIALGVRNIRLAEQVAELAAESERGRIAREIHDGIAQMVYMLTLSLETAVERVGGDPAEQRQRLQDLTALAKAALWEVRQYIFDLRPLLSGDEGLLGALHGQVREFQAVADLPVEFTVTGAAAGLPLDTSAALYRIVQEALGNIFRHARASRVQISLAFSPDCVRLDVADDGVGIGEAEPGGRVGFGMGNLRARVEALHGTLHVRSEAGEGTRIGVTLPMDLPLVTAEGGAA